MNNQPIPDHERSNDTKIMYREMIARQADINEDVGDIIDKRRAREVAEEEIREKWDELTTEEQNARISRLEELCNELIKSHPNYTKFKTAKVKPGSQPGTLRIHWNGANTDKETGWGSIDKEFPKNDTKILIKRYSDRIRLRIKEEEI